MSAGTVELIKLSEIQRTGQWRRTKNVLIHVTLQAALVYATSLDVVLACFNGTV